MDEQAVSALAWGNSPRREEVWSPGIDCGACKKAPITYHEVTSMRSIKPGRAPSWGGVIGGVLATVFGIFWIGAALSLGDAPGLLIGFGVVFVLCAAGGTVYSFYNATSRNRFSDWDITEPHEERDPLHQSPGETSDAATARPAGRSGGGFCPYCGGGVQAAFTFCPRCGKQLPTQAA